MTTQISTKLAAVTLALLINGFMFSSVAYLFVPPSQANVGMVARI